MKSLRHILANEKGGYFLISAIVLSVLVGFAAMGVEVGRWYAIQAEISKSIDGAAFAGAKNVSNPLFSDTNGDPDPALLEAFVEQVAQANFPPSMLGTDTPVFNAVLDAEGKVTVNGTVNSMNDLTTTLEAGTATTALGAVGSAKLRKAEVALVLDVSGSMNDGDAISDLRDGATLFVNNFQSFQKDHKFALLSFATGVQTPFPLDTDFVFDMTNAISGLNANGGTNTEDALGQTVNLPWEPGQLALPVNERTRQVVILFSDGNPSGFRSTFKTGGVDNIDSVGLQFSNGTVASVLGDPADQHTTFGSNVSRTGDGKTSGSACGQNDTTKWYILDDPTYGINAPGSPVAGTFSSPYCLMDPTVGGDFADWETWALRQMAIDHAAELKAQGIAVYTIGLGSIDQTFLETLATDLDHAKFANSSSELNAIFQEIANELKLILIS